MGKNLENVSGKFLMYPRFVQVFLEKQLEGMSNHKRIYVTLSHTKKIFGNMRRVGKGFSGRDTPLFPTMMVQAQQEQGEGSEMPTDPHHTPTIIQPSTSQPQKKQRSRRPKRMDAEIPQSSGHTNNVADEVVNEEIDDSLVRGATTATGLDAEQDSGNINKTQSKATPNEPSSLGTSSGGGPKRQETMGDTIAQTRFENMFKTSNNSLLAGVNTPRSDEDRLKLKKLMEFCTKLKQRVLDLENTKTAQAHEITSLKLRVKNLEKKGGSRTYKLKRLYKGRNIDDIDKDAEITLVDETQGRYGDDIMFDVSDLAGEEVFVTEQGVPDSKKDDVVSTAIVTITPDEITLAQALQELRTAKPKVKEIVFNEQVKSTTTTTRISSQQPSQAIVQDKGCEVRAEGSETRVEGSSKREGEELEQESSKKKKLEEDKESKELKQCLEIVPDDGDDVTIYATPLSTKSPTIVDYKIHKEGKKSFFKLSESGLEAIRCI
ncbi:hypothetical protein Tco_1257998 [Tanacetum coccineum]